MAIKSDKWIIEQAQKNQLISPFASEQIRAHMIAINHALPRNELTSQGHDQELSLMLQDKLTCYLHACIVWWHHTLQ